MKDEEKRELLSYWRKLPYLTYPEAMSLLRGYFPEKNFSFSENEWVRDHYALITRILENDIGQFKLKVYFYERYYSSGILPLLEPECPTTYAALQYYVRPEEHFACFWVFGSLSTQEFTEWLQNNNIPSFFFGTTASPISNNQDDKLLEIPSKSATVVNAASPPHQQPPPEITQKRAVESAEEATPRLKRHEIAESWEKALEEEWNDFTYAYKKSREVFKRIVLDFIEVDIKKATSQYKLNQDGNKNIARDLKEVREKIAPYMIKKYSLPLP